MWNNLKHHKVLDFTGRGQFAEAISLAEEELERARVADGDATESYFLALYNLGRVYSEQHDFEKAIPALRLAAGFVRDKYGARSDEYSQVINPLAYALLRSEQIDDAASLVATALEILEQSGGEGNSNYVAAISLSAYLHQQKNDLASAESLYVRSLQLRAWHFGKASYNFAFGLFNLAYVYALRGKLTAASLASERVLRMHERGDWRGDFLNALILQVEGMVLADLGELHAANRTMAAALEIFSRVRGSDHPTTRRARDELQQIRLRQADGSCDTRFFPAGSARADRPAPGNRKRRIRTEDQEPYPPGLSF